MPKTLALLGTATKHRTVIHAQHLPAYPLGGTDQEHKRLARQSSILDMLFERFQRGPQRLLRRVAEKEYLF